MPVEFTVSLQWKESAREDVMIRYAGVGASRVVYTSCDPDRPYAFKFASLSNAYDDSAREFNASAVPDWLIPRVFGPCKIALGSMEASVLVLA